MAARKAGQATASDLRVVTMGGSVSVVEVVKGQGFPSKWGLALVRLGPPPIVGPPVPTKAAEIMELDRGKRLASFSLFHRRHLHGEQQNTPGGRWTAYSIQSNTGAVVLIRIWHPRCLPSLSSRLRVVCGSGISINPAAWCRGDVTSIGGGGWCELVPVHSV